MKWNDGNLCVASITINSINEDGSINIDELKNIDKKLALKLHADGVVYVAVTTLHNGKNEWGWFGVLYCNMASVPQEREITNELMITSQTIVNTLQVLKK